MAKKMTKQEEGKILMRGGEKIELVKVDNQFSAFLRAGVAPETKSAFKSADRKQKLSEQMGIYEVGPSSLNKVMKDVRKDKDVLFCHHVYESMLRFYLCHLVGRKMLYPMALS